MTLKSPELESVVSDSVRDAVSAPAVLRSFVGAVDGDGDGLCGGSAAGVLNGDGVSEVSVSPNSR